MSTMNAQAKSGPAHELQRAMAMLVVVIVVLTALAGIPGLTTADDAGLQDQLGHVRSAIERYTLDHDGAPPGLASWDDLVRQLTETTNARGEEGDDFGPYLQPEQLEGSGRCVEELPARPTGDSTWLWCPTEQRLALNRAGRASDGTAYYEY